MNYGNDLKPLIFAHLWWPRYNHDNHNTSANPSQHGIDVYNASQLNLIWFQPSATRDFIQTQPVIQDDVIYTYSNNTVLSARNLSDGSLIWEKQLGTLTAGSTPLISGGFIYAATDNDLTLHALNRFTGNQVWQTVINATNFATGQAEIQASISEVDGIIIVPVNCSAEATSKNITIRPTLNAFNALTGALLWSQVFDAVNGTGIGSWSTPAYDRKRKLLLLALAMLTLRQRDLFLIHSKLGII